MSAAPDVAGFSSLAVVGCGLIGGSVALAARSAGVEHVTVVDSDPDVRRRALERGIADDTGETTASVDAELVVVAVPGPAIADVVISLLDRGDPPVVVDTGSTKAPVVREVERWWTARAAGGQAVPGLRYVGGHPMAGSETGGIDHADATLLQGAAFVLTPTGRTDDAAFRRVGAFLRLLGCRVLAMDPDAHDRIVGVVSHLPQVIASTLAGYAAEMSRADPGLLAVAGGGYRDVTRIAGSDPELWTGILRANRTAVLTAIVGFADRLGTIRDAIEAERWDEVEEILAAARAARALAPAKEVDGPVVDLVIPVEDRPAALAEITTALGEAGVNIEDLSMRHAETEARGALVVAVAGEGSAEAAVEALRRRGYAVHVEGR